MLATYFSSSSSVPIRLLAATRVRISNLSKAKMNPSMRERGQNGERGQKTKTGDSVDLEKKEQKW